MWRDLVFIAVVGTNLALHNQVAAESHGHVSGAAAAELIQTAAGVFSPEEGENGWSFSIIDGFDGALWKCTLGSEMDPEAQTVECWRDDNREII